MLINSSSSSTSTATTATAAATAYKHLGTNSKLNNPSSSSCSSSSGNLMMMSSYSASYSNLKSSSSTQSPTTTTHIPTTTITRQSSTLTLSNHNNHMSNNNNNNVVNNNSKTINGGKMIASVNIHHQTVPSHHHHPLNETTPSNTNYSQNNPTLRIDYNTQSTGNSPTLSNKVATSKTGNFLTQPISITSNNTPSNYNQISSLLINNRQSRSTSNGSDFLPTQTNLCVNTLRNSGQRGLVTAVSTSSLSTMETTPKLPPLSLHRLEKSTSDSSLENLKNEEPATPRVVNLDKYFKFAQLIMDEEACDVFLEFLRKKRNEENLEFILQVSILKKIPTLNHVAALEILQRIRSDFLAVGSMYELNVSKQVKSLSIDRVDRYLQQQAMSSSQQSSLNFASSPVLSLHSSPSTVSCLTTSTTQSVDYSYDSPSLISSSCSSLSLLHSSPRDHSESSITSIESSNSSLSYQQPITTGTILKEIELEVRLQLQNESFKEFKASDEFEHFLLTKVIEQSQNNNPINNQSPCNSPHQTETVNSSRSDKSSPSVGSPQSGGFFSKIFKKKPATVQEPKSDESITDDEMSVGSGDSDYVYNPQNPNDIAFVENLQIRKWNNPQVINFFKFKLDLSEYADCLKKNDIKGADLSLLRKDDTPDVASDKVDTSELQKKVDALYKKIKMVKLGHKKKLQREVNEAILSYQRKQQKSSKKSTQERPRKVSDSILPKSQIYSSMEVDLTTIIIKLWILPTDQKRVFTVKRCIKLDRLRAIILKEVGDIVDKKYPSENPSQVVNTRVIKTSKGDSLSTNEKLYQYLCSESTNSQFVTLKIEL